MSSAARVRALARKDLEEVRHQPGLLLPAAAMMVIIPGHITTLIEDPMGPPMIIGALVLQTIGMLAIKKLVNIEY